MAESMFSPPSRPFRASEKRLEWFVKSHSGVETMTYVNTLASSHAGFHLQSPAPSPVIQSRVSDALKRRRRISDHFTTKGE